MPGLTESKPWNPGRKLLGQAGTRPLALPEPREQDVELRDNKEEENRQSSVTEHDRGRKRSSGLALNSGTPKFGLCLVLLMAVGSYSTALSLGVYVYTLAAITIQASWDC